MESIGVGDMVECVRAKNGAKSGFVVGNVYCVSHVETASNWLDDEDIAHGILLHGMRSPPECGLPYDLWCIRGFRLVKRRDESLLKSLLEPTNLEEEKAL